ncbi:MAG: hypothetical protein AAFX06_24745 [Planctomycetota bacterium]
MKRLNVFEYDLRSVVLLGLVLSGLSAANAGNPISIQRVARHLGVGWGDGYHACRYGGCRPGADLPPQSYYQQFGAKRGGCDACNNVYPPNTALCGKASCDQSNCDGAITCDQPGCDGSMTVLSPMSMGHSMPEQVPSDSPMYELMPSAPVPDAGATEARDPEPAKAPEYATPLPEVESAEEVTSPSDSIPALVEPVLDGPEGEGAADELLDQTGRMQPRRLGQPRRIGQPRPQPSRIASRPVTTQPTAQVSPVAPARVYSVPGVPQVQSNPFFPQSAPQARVAEQPRNVIHQPR